jgi:ABC-type glycerol-3-phosphate transport system substrate-binding protein
MKKLFAVLMAMALVLTMGTTFAFAADAGTITITNAVDGADYNIYKMLNICTTNIITNIIYLRCFSHCFRY